MAAMAKVLGLKVEYQDGAFESMTPALPSERVNMIMSGFYDLPKRRPMFTFIDYLRAGAQFYTLISHPEIKELADLCGKTITTSRGTSCGYGEAAVETRTASSRQTWQAGN